jgi:nucleotide-binding universal stress UspA family protein
LLSLKAPARGRRQDGPIPQEQAMEIRDILLFLHAGAPDVAALRLAAGWARAHGAAVTGCGLCPDPQPPIADCYAIGYAGTADVLDRRQARIEVVAHPAEAAFRDACALEGVVADWTVPDPNERAEDLALRARFFDLTIVARAPVADHPAQALAEALALRSGAPCVIAPAAASERSGERVVAAWNGSTQAKRALDDALPLLKRAKAVQLLVVGDSPGWLERCQPELVVRRLARHEVDAELRIATRRGRRNGEDLAHNCEAFGADLLVMGAYSHAPAKEAVLGGATRAVLADFPIPVLMSR